ncbi:MAG: hypothetical protein ABI664_17855, partial [bacterium]
MNSHLQIGDIPRVATGERKSGSLATLVTTLVMLAFASACGGARASTVGGTGAAADSDYDIVIANGRIVDGAGNAWFYGDVAIRGDRIVKIARRGSSLTGRRRIDATGMVVAPGFIDIQAGGNYVSGDGRDV